MEWALCVDTVAIEMQTNIMCNKWNRAIPYIL